MSLTHKKIEEQRRGQKSTVQAIPVVVAKTVVSEAETSFHEGKKSERPQLGDAGAIPDIIAKIGTFSLSRTFWVRLLALCEGNKFHAAMILSWVRGVSHPEESVEAAFRNGLFKKPSEDKKQYPLTDWMKWLLSLIGDYEFAHPGAGLSSGRRPRVEYKS